MTSESDLRHEVATATRILDHEGILNYSGHVSARLPGRDAFLLQPKDVPRGALGGDALLVVDFDGQLVAGDTSRSGVPKEVFIHSEIYRVRDDVGSVLHAHHEPSTLITLVEGLEFLLMKNRAVRWADGVPLHPDPGHINSADRGAAVARTLGACHAASLRAHGQVITAEDPRALLIDAIHFVENTTAVLAASAIGTPIPLTPDEVAQCVADFARFGGRAGHVRKLWEYYLASDVSAHQPRHER